MSLAFSEVWRDSGVDEGSKAHPAAVMVLSLIHISEPTRPY